MCDSALGLSGLFVVDSRPCPVCTNSHRSPPHAPSSVNGEKVPCLSFSCLNKLTYSDSNKDLLNESLLTIVNSQTGDRVRPSVIYMQCEHSGCGLMISLSSLQCERINRQFWLYIVDDLLAQ